MQVLKRQSRINQSGVSYFLIDDPEALSLRLPGLDLGAAELNIHLGPFDLKRLESYANNLVDYHVIMDLLPTVSTLYFEKRLGEGVRLGAVQSSILLALGLQRKTIEGVEVSERCPSRTYIRLTSPQEELNLPVSQALALFAKSMRKICKRLTDIQKSAFETELPSPPTANGSGDQKTIKAAEVLKKMKPVEVTINDELREAGNEVTRDLREKQREMINSLDLSKYVPSFGREGPLNHPIPRLTI